MRALGGNVVKFIRAFIDGMKSGLSPYDAFGFAMYFSIKSMEGMSFGRCGTVFKRRVESYKYRV